MRRTNASASCAPQCLSMPESSHSTESSPSYPIRLSSRIISSKSTSPCPGETVPARAWSLKSTCSRGCSAGRPAPLRVLDVHVVDAVRERGNELGRVQELVDQMAGIEVDPERGCRPTASRARAVVGKSYAISVGCTSRPKRTPSSRRPRGWVATVRRSPRTPVDLRPVVGRERIEHVRSRPGKAVHLGDAERRRGAGRVGHARGCRLV